MQVDEADTDNVESTLAAFMLGRDARSFECRLSPAQAQTRWIRASLTWIISQKLLQIAFIDISSEKQTEAHSRQNQALLIVALVEHANFSFYLVAAQRPSKFLIIDSNRKNVGFYTMAAVRDNALITGCAQNPLAARNKMPATKPKEAPTAKPVM